MSYHKDPEVNQAINDLLAALCSWERQTGRRSTLILIPHFSDEHVVKALDGKPLPEFPENEYPAKRMIELALRERQADYDRKKRLPLREKKNGVS